MRVKVSKIKDQLDVIMSPMNPKSEEEGDLSPENQKNLKVFVDNKKRYSQENNEEDNLKDYDDIF